MSSQMQQAEEEILNLIKKKKLFGFLKLILMKLSFQNISLVSNLILLI